MNGLKRQHLFFGAAALAFLLFFALTVTGFVLSAQTSGFSVPEKNQKIVSVQTEGDSVFVTTEDRALARYDGKEKTWEAELIDRTADVVLTPEYVVVSYVSERKIEIFAREAGAKEKSFAIDYPVTSVAVHNRELYVAAKRGGLRGSVLYCFEDFTASETFTSLSLSNVIADLAVDPATGTAYGVSTDYTVYSFARSGNGLVASPFVTVEYEPLALGFTKSGLVVADKTGNLSVFAGNKRARVIATGMSLCAFGCNPVTDTVVVANISGTAAVVNAATGKYSKVAAPTEVQNIAVSESGVISLSEYRSFRTKFYDADKIGALLFWRWARYAALALTILSVPLAVAGWFAIDSRRSVTLNKTLRRFKIGFGKTWRSYAFILPTFVLLGLFMYVPAVWGLILSFFDYVPGVYTRPVGFANFIAVLKDPFFTGGIGNMLIFLVTDLIKALLPAVLIAELILALNSKRAQYWVRVLIYVPGILPGVAVLLIWTKGIYGDMGLLNSIASLFGGNGTDWLGNDSTALASLIMIGLPWVGQYILFYGALMSVPDSYKESAKLDGCSWIKSIFYIDLPMIAPQLKYVFIITFINSIQDFGRVYMTTGQITATNIPSLQMYMTLNSGSGYGRAAAMGMLLFIVVFGATLFNMKAQKTESNF